MASVARVIHCQLRPHKRAAMTMMRRDQSAGLKREPLSLVQFQKGKVGESEKGKIMLQPRLCTLRSYGSDKAAMIKTKSDGGDEVSSFFETLSDYIESSRKSQDFEIISGRLAMIIFAATVTMEMVTGNSIFRKMDVQGITEAAGVCVGAVTFAAAFAWFSSARSRVTRMFTLSCNTFFDSLIDQIVDGLFYESELTDWSDEI